MFVAGKTYRHPISKNIFEVLYVGKNKAFGIHSDMGEMSMLCSHGVHNGWEEIVPKPTITKWVNVYKTSEKTLRFGKLYADRDYAITKSKDKAGDDIYIYPLCVP